MILTTRKLTKKHFPTFSQSKTYVLTILKCDLPILESELNIMQWDKVMDKDDAHIFYDELMNVVEGIIGRFLKSIRTQIGNLLYLG